MSKKLSKYIAAFNYIDKNLIVLSATSEGVSITSFASVIGPPAGMTSVSFTLVFPLITGIKNKILSIIEIKRRNITRFLCLLKIN